MSLGEDAAQRLIPKVPTIQRPFNVPTISVPFIGCFSGDGQTYVGRRWGNRPDILKLNHLKQKIKEYEQRIITMTIGQLDNPPRKIGFIEEIARITADIVTMTNDAMETIGAITEEINAGLQLVNEKINELNSLQAEILNTPAELRSKVDQHMLQRYDEYFGELEAQAARLNATKNCLGVF